MAQHIAVSLWLTGRRLLIILRLRLQNRGGSPQISGSRTGEPEAHRKVLRQRRNCA